MNEREKRNQERRVRAKATRQGYAVRKSRRAESLENKGEFRLVDVSTDLPVLGSYYDADLDEIEKFLDEASA